MLKPKHVPTWLGFLTLCAIALACYSILPQKEYEFINSQYKYENQSSWNTFDWPLDVNTRKQKRVIEIQTSFQKKIFTPSTVTIHADDCLEELKINKKLVSEIEYPFCNYKQGLILNIEPYLQGNSNSLYANIKNRGGPAQFTMKPGTHWFKGGNILIFILVVLALTYAYIRKFKPKKLTASLVWTFVFGVIIRFIYIANTPYRTRGHDVLGHLEYVKYLLEHYSLPPRSGGWEFYQPPLYYTFPAIIYKFGELIGKTEQLIHRDIQFFAFLTSIGAFACVVWIAYLLYKKKKEQHMQILFVLMLSVIPGIVFFASRVNNDVLVHFFMYLALALLFVWWKGGESKYWHGSMLAIALGIISKTNALLLLPVSYLLLLLRKKTPWMQKVQLGSIGLVIILVFTGWFFAQRVLVENQTYIVGNAKSMNGNLRIENKLIYYTKFNPIRLIQNPYNTPWQQREDKAYFFEYLYRSAFFGEFHFDHHPTIGTYMKYFSSFIIFEGLVLLIFALYGFIQLLRKHNDPWLWPMTILFGILMAGHLAMRHMPPSSAPGQDFRYSFLLTIPIVYFALYGLQFLPKSIRKASMYFFYTFVGTCTLFLLIICFVNT